MSDYDDEGREFETFPFTVNLSKVSKDKSFLPLTRLLAVELIENPYMTVGAFIKGLPDNDIHDMMELIERDNDAALENMLLITEMLAQAEGLVSEDLAELTDRCNTLVTYFTIESLRRRNLVRVFHENMSFGEEFGDRVIVERI